jgi:putative transposase
MAGARDRLPRVRPAASAALRQRGAVRLVRGGRAVAAVGQSDQAGVVPERIAPGKPQQNGRLERLHLTLLQDIASPPARSLREQLARLHSFQCPYNEERPHQALSNDTPAARYVASARHFNGVLRAPNYGADHEVRHVRHNGEIRWHGGTIYISEALVGEPVGLIGDDDGDWNVFDGPIALGVIAHGGDRLRKPKRRACGPVDNAKTRCPQGPQVEQQQQQADLNETRNLLPMSPG